MSFSFISDGMGWGCLWQGTACLALGLAGSLLLRRHAARAHQVLRLGMLAAILVPILSFFVRQQGLGVLPPMPAQVSVDTQDIQATSPWQTMAPLVLPETVQWELPVYPVADPLPVMPLANPQPEVETATVARTSWSIPWQQIALLIWPVVGLVFLFRLARTFVLGMRLLRGARLAKNARLYRAAQRACTKLNVHTNVTIKESEAVSSPAIWCWGPRPVLLVPCGFADTSSKDWLGVFCHELAHWKRRDHRTGLWAELWLCVFWWHPLVWWIRQRLEFLSEQACDDWVLASGQSGCDYAESLLGLTPEARMACLPSIVGKEKTMKDRILRIVKNRNGNPQVGRQWAVIVCLLTSFLVVGTALAQRRAPRIEREEHESWQIQRGAVIDEREMEEDFEELVEEIEEVKEELEEAIEELRDLEEELEEEGEADEDDREEARELRREIRNLELRLGKLNRERQAMEREHDKRMQAEHRERQEKQQRLEWEMKELVRVIMQCQEEFDRLDDKDSDQAHMLYEKRQNAQRKLDHLRSAMEDMHSLNLAELEAHRRELAVHQRELTEHRRRLQVELRELEDKNPEKAAHVREELKRIDKELVKLKQARRQMPQVNPPFQPEPRPQDARRRHAELAAKAESIRRALEAIGDRNEDLAERLERELHEIHAQMEEIERATQDRPEPERRDLEAKVLQLNEKVESLSGEMREIRALLERLVDQQREQVVERQGRGTRGRSRVVDGYGGYGLEDDDDEHDEDHDDEEDDEDDRKAY
ncbi:M56 family metallopeptidase [Planctomycetota bacterium]